MPNWAEILAFPPITIPRQLFERDLSSTGSGLTRLVNASEENHE